jgi:hypothetical protein
MPQEAFKTIKKRLKSQGHKGVSQADMERYWDEAMDQAKDKKLKGDSKYAYAMEVTLRRSTKSGGAEHEYETKDEEKERKEKEKDKSMKEDKRLTDPEFVARMITSDLDVNNGLLEEMDEGSFTEWCKRQGFEGPCKECGEKGLKSDNPAIVKKANFYMNTVKP